MSKGAIIAIDGIGEVNKLLASLNNYPKQQKQLIQVGGRAALRPTVRAMRGAIRTSKTGNLKRSIGTKSAKRTPTVIAGPRSSKKRGWDGKFVGGKHKGGHALLYEYGSAPRKTRRGHNRGVMPALNRLMPAAQSTKSVVMRIYRDKIKDSFEKYAKKAGLMP